MEFNRAGPGHSARVGVTTFRGAFSGGAREYPGDALWALMVFIGWVLFFRRRSTLQIFIFTLADCLWRGISETLSRAVVDDFRASNHRPFDSRLRFLVAKFNCYTIGGGSGSGGETNPVSKSRV